MNDCKLIEIVNIIELNKTIVYELYDYINEHMIKTLDKLKSVIRDIEISISANNELRKVQISYIDKHNNQLSCPITNTNSILYSITSSSSSWSQLNKHISSSYEINYPMAIKYIVNTLSAFYNHKCPQRKLRILNDISTVIVNYKNYKLKLTLGQASVLLLFQNNLVLGLDEIKQLLSIDTCDGIDKNVKKICDSLVESTFVLKVNSLYKFNLQIRLPRQYNNGKNIVSINKFYNKRTDKLENNKNNIKKSITSIVEYDRMSTMKCYIIKICKKDKDIEFSILEIFNKLKTNLTIFDYDIIMVENVIEQLVKSFYLDKIINKYKFIDD